MRCERMNGGMEEILRRGGWAHISGGDQLGKIRGTNGTRKAGVHTLHGRQSMICPL